MDQIQREKIAEKLKKIKALAERGVGGEKQTAQQMYEALKKRYEISDEEVNRAAVPVDINKIDLKQFWGIAFQMAAATNTLHEENQICNECPYTYNSEKCYEECGTFWNIRDLQEQYESIQRRLEKAAMEV